mmetsp:Transcript_28070/g.26933  ORF Transcript_28070/g.26933 Transcript_28070/m.26933 type:complete len:87 (+) Transcript_28070:117-377(+)
MVARHGKHLITLKDLKITKLNKAKKISPCSQELEAFLAAVVNFGGNEDKVPNGIRKALAVCMDTGVERNKPASVMYHVAKFVKNEK